jgi:hypothetical protein
MNTRLEAILNQSNPFQNITFHFFKILLNTSWFQKWSPPFWFFHQNVCISHITMHAACHAHLSCFDLITLIFGKAKLITRVVRQLTTANMRCGYEVTGMILLQACQYTYSLLRRVTFKVLTFSSYALSPVMLPLLETFLELLSQNSSQCHHHIFLDVNILKSLSL